jgi:hypothetical protein
MASHRECPPTACKHAVSGSLSLPSPGCFSPFPHGTCSLSVMDHYLALEDGPPSFSQGCSCPVILGNNAQKERSISPTGLSPSVVVLSRSLRLSISFLTLRLAPSVTPQPPLCCQSGFRLFPVRSPLLRESRLISVPGGTEMFHFPPWASRLCFLETRRTRYYPSQVSPFGHPRLTARLAAPRGFSQLAAPFIACPCLGIPRMPLVAYPSLS